MIANVYLKCSGVIMGRLGRPEPQAELFDAYGRKFRDAINHFDTEKHDRYSIYCEEAGLPEIEFQGRPRHR